MEGIQPYTIIIGCGMVEDKEETIVLGNNVRIAPHVILAANHRF